MKPVPAVEAFLMRFHDARPGLTTQAFAGRPVLLRGQQHASSYEVLASAVPHPASALQVLDLACGDGFLLSRLAARAEPLGGLCGVDLSAGELAAAAGRVGASVGLARARAQALPLADGSVDVVLCHMALMLMDDVPRVLAEVRRVLRPGGRFAAVLGMRAPPSPAFTHVVRVVTSRQRDPAWSGVRFGDARLQSPEGIADLWASTGFRAVQVEQLEVPLRLSPQELWLWLLNMYDLHLLRAPDREALRAELLDAVAADCEADGQLAFPQAMRYVVGEAAALPGTGGSGGSDELQA